MSREVEMVVTVKELTAAEVLRVAVESSTDPRTVRRLMRGKPTRSLTSERIVRVLRRYGYLVESNGKGVARR